MKERISDWATEFEMSGDEAKQICRVGQGAKCCAFLVMAPTGFECIRMSYPNNGTIFDRLKNGTMNAKGEGGWEGCAWFGRIKNSDQPLDPAHAD